MSVRHNNPLFMDSHSEKVTKLLKTSPPFIVKYGVIIILILLLILTLLVFTINYKEGLTIVDYIIKYK